MDEQVPPVVGPPKSTLEAVHMFGSVETVTGAGQDTKGGSLSMTVTTCVQASKFPKASVAVQVTMVVPMGKLVGASLVIVTLLQLPEMVGLPSATPVAMHVPGSVVTVISGAQAVNSTGSVVLA